jgi:hypothetical protein
MKVNSLESIYTTLISTCATSNKFVPGTTAQGACPCVHHRYRYRYRLVGCMLGSEIAHEITLLSISSTRFVSAILQSRVNQEQSFCPILSIIMYQVQ